MTFLDPAEQHLNNCSISCRHWVLTWLCRLMCWVLIAITMFLCIYFGEIVKASTVLKNLQILTVQMFGLPIFNNEISFSRPRQTGFNSSYRKKQAFQSLPLTYVEFIVWKTQMPDMRGKNSQQQKSVPPKVVPTAGKGVSQRSEKNKISEESEIYGLSRLFIYWNNSLIPRQSEMFNFDP